MSHVFVVPEFYDLYKKEETYDPSYSSLEQFAPACYDHIWIAALALNCTETYLKTTGWYCFIVIP